MKTLAKNIIAVLSLASAISPGTAFCQDAPTENLERLAVLQFETRGLPREDGAQLWRSFSDVLANLKRFDIMPENVLNNNLSLAGLGNIDSCNTRACLAQLGKILDVAKVVHVKVDRWDDRYILNIRLVNSSDGALLYSERVDYTGSFQNLLSTVIPEQATKLNSAFLDKKPNWYLIAAAVIVGVGIIYWIYSNFASASAEENDISSTTPAQQ
jgi:TolB-like protein